MSDKRCGTCGLHKRHAPVKQGRCCWINILGNLARLDRSLMPFWFDNLSHKEADDAKWTTKNDGQDCPCWKAK